MRAPNSTVPSGLSSNRPSHPTFKRWAIFADPFGIANAVAGLVGKTIRASDFLIVSSFVLRRSSLRQIEFFSIPGQPIIAEDGRFDIADSGFDARVGKRGHREDQGRFASENFL